jgi:hypothetical protein
MTDYHPLIARAVDGLAKNTGEARRALYERARSALVAQLRSVEPALSESDITKERLALEEAIRKVESEAARKALTEPRPQPRAEPRSQPRAAAAPAPRLVTPEAKAPLRPDPGPEPAREPAKIATAELPRTESADAPRTEARQLPSSEQNDAAAEAEAPLASGKPSARSRILGARTSSISHEGIKGFRNFVKDVDGFGAASAKTAQTARDTRDSYGPAQRLRLPQEEEISEPPPVDDQIEPQFEQERMPVAEHSRLPLQSLEPSYDVEEVEPMPAPRPMRPQPPRAMLQEEEDYEEPRPPRSYRGWAKGAALLIVAFCVVLAAWAFRSNIASTYHSFTQPKPPPSSQTAQTSPPASKFDGRVPQEQLPGQAPSTGASPGTQQQAPAVAQRAVLYEADPNDPKGKRFAGSVVWRTETVSPGPGLAPELVVRADIAIPERHMNVTWSLRRNTDKALPASHTIEIMFNLPADFPGGGISNVPGILMKDSEEVRGMPLAGLAVKVTNGFFLIGLNAADDDMQRNLQLLKERSWFDVLIVYNNGSRAILTLEKGPPGDHAFADAFAAWGQ